MNLEKIDPNTKDEIIKREIKIYGKLKLPDIKTGFRFTFPKETREKYPEYFI